MLAFLDRNYHSEWTGNRRGQKNQCPGVAQRGLRRGWEKAEKALNFSTPALCKVRPVVAWQDLCVSGSEGHKQWEENPWTMWVDGMPGGCDATEEPTFAQSAEQEEKKNKIGYWLLYQSRDFKKWFLWRKLWALRSGKDCVTWPGGEGIWCAALITMWDHLPPSQQSWAQMRNNREQNMTSSNFGGNSHSVSDILETARGKSERDKVSVSLWPLSSASVRIAD